MNTQLIGHKLQVANYLQTLLPGDGKHEQSISQRGYLTRMENYTVDEDTELAME